MKIVRTLAKLESMLFVKLETIEVIVNFMYIMDGQTENLEQEGCIGL
ncbi:hypothetical protein [Crassaminicella profunda]|nr:hypothetical protein [Crassaminicella profunda]QZY56741.1 hypothetical protein K7H06_07410 [Crassaminicella profunda]